MRPLRERRKRRGSGMPRPPRGPEHLRPFTAPEHLKSRLPRRSESRGVSDPAPKRDEPGSAKKSILAPMAEVLGAEWYLNSKEGEPVAAAEEASAATDAPTESPRTSAPITRRKAPAARTFEEEERLI